MKATFVLSLAMAAILFSGCSKQEHECGELSWTEYNTVEDVWCHFMYKRNETKAYLDDTLKVYGWAYMGRRDSINGAPGFLLFSCKEHRNITSGSELYNLPNVYVVSAIMLNDSMFPSNPFDTLLYVKGILKYDSEPGDFFVLLNEIK